MNAIPVLMKGPLVRASIADVKTSMRVLVGSANTTIEGICKVPILKATHVSIGNGLTSAGVPWLEMWGSEQGYSRGYCRMAPGDMLWVREQWAARANESQCVAYKADGLCGVWFGDGGGGRFWETHGFILGVGRGKTEGPSVGLPRYGGEWKPALFMPRGLCRLELEILTVRVERLQDITDDAIRDEGVMGLTLNDLLEIGATKHGILSQLGAVLPHYQGPAWWTWQRALRMWENAMTPCERWRVYWDLTYGDRPGARWSDNPWVWVVQFKRVQ